VPTGPGARPKHCRNVPRRTVSRYSLTRRVRHCTPARPTMRRWWAQGLPVDGVMGRVADFHESCREEDYRSTRRTWYSGRAHPDDIAGVSTLKRGPGIERRELGPGHGADRRVSARVRELGDARRDALGMGAADGSLVGTTTYARPHAGTGTPSVNPPAPDFATRVRVAPRAGLS
jgi:hypothetical protein